MTGTVTLSSAAPAGGAVVTLSSSSNAAIVPSSVTVQAGATSATFTVTAGLVSAATPATITASYGGGSAQATLSVTASSGGGTLPQFFAITIGATSASLSAPGTLFGLNAGIVGSLGAITSASMTITLTPVGAPGIGSASGSFSLSSPVGNVSGTFTGNYRTIAQ